MKQVAPLVDKDSCATEENKQLARHLMAKGTKPSIDSMFAYHSQQTQICFKTDGWMEGVTSEDDSIGSKAAQVDRSEDEEGFKTQREDAQEEGVEKIIHVPEDYLEREQGGEDNAPLAGRFIAATGEFED